MHSSIQIGPSNQLFTLFKVFIYNKEAQYCPLFEYHSFSANQNEGAYS